MIQKEVRVRGDPGGIIYKFKVRLHNLKAINIKSNGLFSNFVDLFFHVPFFFQIKHQMKVQNVRLAVAMVGVDTK